VNRRQSAGIAYVSLPSTARLQLPGAFVDKVNLTQPLQRIALSAELIERQGAVFG